MYLHPSACDWANPSTLGHANQRAEAAGKPSDGHPGLLH